MKTRPKPKTTPPPVETNTDSKKEPLPENTALSPLARVLAVAVMGVFFDVAIIGAKQNSYPVVLVAAVAVFGALFTVAFGQVPKWWADMWKRLL